MIGDSPIYAKDVRITLNTSPSGDTAEKRGDWGPADRHPPPSSLDAETRPQE